MAREGKYELAIEHYKTALRLDSHLPGLQLNLGLAYFKSNRLPEAAKAFRAKRAEAKHAAEQAAAAARVQVAVLTPAEIEQLRGKSADTKG